MCDKRIYDTLYMGLYSVVGNDIARVYASSLMESAQSGGILQSVEEELAFLAELVRSDNGFNSFLLNPGISREKKKGLVASVFSGRVSDVTVGFLNVLIENDRQSLIISVQNAFAEIMDTLNNRLRVTVVSSTPLDDGTRKSILDNLKRKYNKEIILNESVEQSILGGVIIKIGDLVIDGSLAKDLKNIRANLITTTVRSEAAYED